MGLKEKRTIEKILDNIAVNSLIESFYPTYISKKTGYPLSDVFDILLLFVADDYLNLEWEIRCTEYSCSRAIKRMSAPILDVEEYLNCVCGEENVITFENIYPVFSFTSEYRLTVLEEKREVIVKVKKKELQREYSQLNSPCSLAELARYKKIDLGENSCYAVINNIHTDTCNIVKQGGNEVGDRYDFNGASVHANNSNVNLGVSNKIKANTEPFKDVTRDLVEALSLIKDDSNYGELLNGIWKIEEQLEKDTPDYSYISFLKQGLEKAYNTVTKPAALVTAYSVWERILNGLCK